MLDDMMEEVLDMFYVDKELVKELDALFGEWSPAYTRLNEKISVTFDARSKKDARNIVTKIFREYKAIPDKFDNLLPLYQAISLIGNIRVTTYTPPDWMIVHEKPSGSAEIVTDKYHFSIKFLLADFKDNFTLVYAGEDWVKGIKKEYWANVIPNVSYITDKHNHATCYASNDSESKLLLHMFSE